MSNKVAGIDVHKKVLMVVVMDPGTPDVKPERRRFSTMPSELHHLSTWLQERGVEQVVMESTAQYWRSVWLELEPHINVHLAQAFSNRASRGLQGCGTAGAEVHGQGINPEFCARGRIMSCSAWKRRMHRGFPQTQRPETSSS